MPYYKKKDLQNGIKHLISSSRTMWLENDEVIDDITCIFVNLNWIMIYFIFCIFKFKIILKMSSLVERFK